MLFNCHLSLCWLQLPGVEDGKHNEEYCEAGSREDHHGGGKAIGTSDQQSRAKKSYSDSSNRADFDFSEQIIVPYCI